MVAEFSLIAFDGGEEIIGLFVLDEKAGGLSLGVQSIGRDDLALDVDIPEQAA